MPASFCLIRPNSAIALPNWRRSFAYFTAWFSAMRTPDMLRAPSFTRPKFSTLNATLCPWPIVPRTFSTGTFTLSSISAVVDDPSSPSLISSRPLTTPMLRSTRNAVNLSPPTLAKIVNRSAKPPFVIHIFCPFSS